VRARYYDASTGRFISEDPAGFVDGPNLYVYAGNNPIINVDPNGLWTLQIGFTQTAGAGAGGHEEVGLAIGYSQKHGVQIGYYQTVGIGGLGGAAFSPGGLGITYSNNAHIEGVGGQSGIVGGSVPTLIPGISAGMDVTINQGAKPSYSFNVGAGLGTPELHGFYAKTKVTTLYGKRVGGKKLH
jgi:hypothetical protein